MKKVFLIMGMVLAVTLTTAGAIVARVISNFNEMEGYREVDVVQYEYDGIRYNQDELSEELVRTWDNGNLFRVVMDITFEDGDIFSAVCDKDGTHFYYTLFGHKFDVSGLSGSEIECTSETIWEEVTPV